MTTQTARRTLGLGQNTSSEPLAFGGGEIRHQKGVLSAVSGYCFVRHYIPSRRYTGAFASSRRGPAPRILRKASNESSNSSERIPLVMKTIRDRRSSSGHSRKWSGGCITCWTPLSSTGPASPTSRRPFTRKTSSPRAWSSILNQTPKAAQSTGPSKVKEVECVRDTWRAFPFPGPGFSGGSLHTSAPLRDLSGDQSAVRKRSIGSTSPKEASTMLAEGLVPPSLLRRTLVTTAFAISVLVRTTTSAAATCLVDSGLLSRYVSALRASTVQITRST